MKKMLAFTLAVMMILSSLCAAFAEATTEEEEEALLEEYQENLKKTDRSFTIPISIGIIYSVVLHKDRVSVVFQPIKGAGAQLGIETLSFMTDLKAIDVHLANGDVVTLPAVIEIERYEKLGTFITLNLTSSTASSISQITSNESPVIKFSFIQNDNSAHDMTVDELNTTLSAITGGAVDIINQISSAVSIFWGDLSNGVGAFYSDAYTTVETALIDAGDFISDTAATVGQAISDTASTVGQALSDAADTAGEALTDALDATGEFLGEAADTVSNFWNNLWGK